MNEMYSIQLRACGQTLRLNWNTTKSYENSRLPRVSICSSLLHCHYHYLRPSLLWITTRDGDLKTADGFNFLQAVDYKQWAMSQLN